MQYHSAAQQVARRRSNADEKAVHAQRVAAGIAKDTATREHYKRMVQLNTLCARAGYPWYMRLGCSETELEAMLQDAAAAEAAEVEAVADERADIPDRHWSDNPAYYVDGEQ